MQTIGDPDAMRAAASALRLRAEQIFDVAHRVGHAADTAVYAGPSANRLRDVTADRHQRLCAAACRVQDTADLLVRVAAEVQEAQYAEAQLAAARAALGNATDM